MDRFTKFVLAVIAVALLAIAAKPSAPEAHAQSFLSGAPTVGDFQDAKTPGDKARLLRRIPVIRVQGGTISVN